MAASNGVHVYVGTCGNLTCYAGDDDSGSGYTSVVNFNVTAGTAYIAFDDNWTSAGFTFQVMYTPPPHLHPVDSRRNMCPLLLTQICVVDMNADGYADDAVSVNRNQININYQLPGGGFNNVVYTTTNADNTPYWSMCAGEMLPMATATTTWCTLAAASPL